MKRIKHSAKASVRRLLTMAPDSDSSESSCWSRSSSKSLGKWSKPSSELGPVIRTVRLKTKQSKPNKPTTITPTQCEEVIVLGTKQCAYFDLSQEESKEHSLLPGTPFETLKKENELFFTYDPRGSKEVDDRYCPHCKCPKSYCSETVFGQVVKKQLMFFIDEIGGPKNNDVNGDSTFYNFQKIYSEEVHHKMLTNGIEVPTGYDFHTLITLPDCVFNGSMKEVIKKCTETKEMKFQLGDPWVYEARKRKEKKG